MCLSARHSWHALASAVLYSWPLFLCHFPFLPRAFFLFLAWCRSSLHSCANVQVWYCANRMMASVFRLFFPWSLNWKLPRNCLTLWNTTCVQILCFDIFSVRQCNSHRKKEFECQTSVCTKVNRTRDEKQTKRIRGTEAWSKKDPTQPAFRTLCHLEHLENTAKAIYIYIACFLECCTMWTVLVLIALLFCSLAEHKADGSLDKEMKKPIYLQKEVSHCTLCSHYSLEKFLETWTRHLERRIPISLPPPFVPPSGEKKSVSFSVVQVFISQNLQAQLSSIFPCRMCTLLSETSFCQTANNMHNPSEQCSDRKLRNVPRLIQTPGRMWLFFVLHVCIFSLELFLDNFFACLSVYFFFCVFFFFFFLVWGLF